MTASGSEFKHRTEISPFRDLDNLYLGLVGGQFEVTMLRVMAPFVTAVTIGWAVATVVTERTALGAVTGYLLAGASVAVWLAVLLLVSSDVQPTVSVLAAIASSAAFSQGLAPIVIVAGVGVVVASSVPATADGSARLVGDRCLLVVPVCAGAVIATTAARIEGWPLHALVSASALGVLALFLAFVSPLPRSVGVVNAGCFLLSTVIVFIGLGWSWTRLEISLAAAATFSIIAFLGAYHGVTRSLVDVAVTRRLMSGLKSSSQHIYDDLHEIVLNKLGMAISLSQSLESPDIERELRDVEAEVRAFRAIDMSQPDERVDEVLDAVSRRYTAVVDTTIPTIPTDTAIALTSAEARHFRRVVNELLGNVARHAARPSPNAGRVRVEVTASCDRQRFEMHIVDDGPGLAAVPARGVLASLFATTNSLPGWHLAHVPDHRGAHFRLTILTSRTAR